MQIMNHKNTGKVLGFAAIMALSAFSQARDVTVSVDGNRVNFEGTQPQMMGDHVMVPLRGVFERLGATVEWQQGDQTVLAQRGDTRIELRINNNQAYINGKATTVNYPAQMVQGSTMVPIRFISEALGAYVDWDESSAMVMISSHGPNVDSNNFNNSNNRDRSNNGNNRDRGNNDSNSNNDSARPSVVSIQPQGSVLPVKLDDTLRSDEARVGDKFTATIDTNGGRDYFGLPQGTRVEGHVDFAQAKSSDRPGVLGLAFDRLVLADGRKVPITASLIGLDKDSVTNDNGRMMVNQNGKKKDDLKYVGTGAGAGALLAIVSKGNIITDSVIGGALGYLYQQLEGSKDKSKNVVLDRGSPLGVRFDREAKIKVYTN